MSVYYAEQTSVARQSCERPQRVIESDNERRQTAERIEVVDARAQIGA